MHSQPKRRNQQSFAALGCLLLGGGSGILRQAGRNHGFYEVLGETNQATWAAPVGWLMVVAGCVVLIAGLARLLRTE